MSVCGHRHPPSRSRTPWSTDGRRQPPTHELDEMTTRVAWYPSTFVMARKPRTARAAQPVFPACTGDVDFRAAAFTAGDSRFIVMSLPSPPAEASALTAAERVVH